MKDLLEQISKLGYTNEVEEVIKKGKERLLILKKQEKEKNINNKMLFARIGGKAKLTTKIGKKETEIEGEIIALTKEGKVKVRTILTGKDEKKEVKDISQNILKIEIYDFNNKKWV